MIVYLYTMQTFLPYIDFEKSAQVLDYRRLGKQRVEAQQILNLLMDPTLKSRWRSHPCVAMWTGYEEALKKYITVMIREWVKRGYKNTMNTYDIQSNIEYPWWLGVEKFHRAMRSRLIVKQPEIYRHRFPEDEGYNEGLYWWPTNETRTFRLIVDKKKPGAKRVGN